VKRLCSRSVLAVLLAALLFSGGSLLALAQDGTVTAQPTTFELTQGWYQGQEISYYDFGSNSRVILDGCQVGAAPIYVLATGIDNECSPEAVPDQNNIVDIVPGDPGYSDLWQVVVVQVPEDYEANSLTSAQQVLDSDYPMTTTLTTINCPIVPEGSELAAGGAPLVTGWHQGEEIFYFDFGTNPAQTAPIYVFSTGMDEQGNPQLVQGQNNIIDVIPGDEGYSDFWTVNLVTVPEDYEANSVTSVSEIMEAGYPITRTNQVVNCPVVQTEGVQRDGDQTGTPEGTPQGTLQMTPEGTPQGTPEVTPEAGAGSLGSTLGLVGASVAVVALGILINRRNKA